MRKILFFCLILLLFSCSKPVTNDDIPLLEGLWEIENVQMPDGTEKNYKVSEIIDRFSMNGLTGTRTKVRVSFDGGYPDASGADSILVYFDGAKALLRHRAEHTQWEEEIVDLDPGKLVLRNAEGIEYQFKRHTPIDLNQ